jgi:ABC-type phosphate transport system substrate-binding protein
MKYRNLAQLILFTACLLPPLAATAGVAVVVNPDLNLAQADADSIKRLYLGKTSKLLGIKLYPVDQVEGAPIRDEFYSKIVEKDASQLKAYWAQLIFTGGGSPPDVVSNDHEVKKLVRSKNSAIGYIDSRLVDDSVKVLFSTD